MRAAAGLMLAMMAGGATAAPKDAPPNYATVLANAARPAEDRARDAARKPAELLAFAGVQRGQVVLDYIMGGGYMTRILAAAVGPKGQVYAYQPEEFIRALPKYGEAQKAVADAYPNVLPIGGALATPSLPGDLDVIITVQNYHDLHLTAFSPDTAARADARLFGALKPGGTLLVVDHVGPRGLVAGDMKGLHRIDPAAVRAELEKAGFRYDGELRILRNPKDPHTANVFDPAIRGRTDQFVYRFRKPG